MIVSQHGLVHIVYMVHFVLKYTLPFCLSVSEIIPAESKHGAFQETGRRHPVLLLCSAEPTAYEYSDDASIIGPDRAVFNIKRNSYRLVVAINYRHQIVFIKWIGTHEDYDEIDVKTVRYGHQAH